MACRVTDNQLALNSPELPTWIHYSVKIHSEETEEAEQRIRDRVARKDLTSALLVFKMEGVGRVQGGACSF